MVAFDPRKDAINRRKHGISLLRASEFQFDTALVLVDDREDYGEVRYRSIGFLDAKLYALVYIEIPSGIRAISLRKASAYEQKEFARSHAAGS